MAAGTAYALRRTSARFVLVVGVGGLVWTAFVTQPYQLPGGTGTWPIPNPRDAYRFLGFGFSSWEATAALLLAGIAVVAGAVVWPGRAISR
jgi:hypothetical protein